MFKSGAGLWQHSGKWITAAFIPNSLAYWCYENVPVIENALSALEQQPFAITRDRPTFIR